MVDSHKVVMAVFTANAEYKLENWSLKEWRAYVSALKVSIPDFQKIVSDHDPFVFAEFSRLWQKALDE